jgi:hypothetical protein
MTAYAAACRRTEIGIRMALGSTGAGVMRLVVSREVWLVMAGIFIGSGISAGASRFVVTLLYGIEPRDPLTLVGAALVLVSVGIAAASVPAWRAPRLDPAQVLRRNVEPTAPRYSKPRADRPPDEIGWNAEDRQKLLDVMTCIFRQHLCFSSSRISGLHGVFKFAQVLPRRRD